MKILAVGDAHFRLQLPYAQVVSDGRRSEWEAVKEKIHEIARGVDVVVLLGDNLNSRHNHSSVNREFIDFLKGFGDKSVHIIAGNHERFGKETALDFLEKIRYPKWHVYTGVPDRAIYLNDKVRATFLPYLSPVLLGATSNEEATEKVMALLPEAEVLFHHHAVAGSVWSSSSSEHLSEIVLPRDGLEQKYKWVLGGHIHEPQRLTQKIWVCGNIFPSEIGEHTKSVWVLDTDTGEVEDIELPVRGIHGIEWKGDEFLAHLPNSAIVKCTVTQRGTDMAIVERALKRFDGKVIVEKYPNQRERVSVDESKGLDLSMGSLLRLYSEARKVPLEQLTAGVALLDQNEISRT